GAKEKKTSKSMFEKLAEEIKNAYNKSGEAFKKKENIQKEAMGCKFGEFAPTRKRGKHGKAAFLPKKGGRILYKLLQGAAKSLVKKKEKTSDFYLDKVEKASPYAIRVGYNQVWNNCYFSEGKRDRINWLERDKLIRDYFSSALPNTVRLRAEYSTNSIFLYLYISELSLVLGENNERLNKIIKNVYKIINDDKVAVKINLIEIKKTYAHAQSIANLIAGQLQKRIFSGMVLRNVLNKISLEKGEVKGVKIKLKGLMDNSKIAQTKKVTQNKMPLSEIDSNIDEGKKVAVTVRGTIGIKYEGHAKGNQEVNFGDYGLQAQEGTYISNRAIEAGRKVISPFVKKTGKMWIRIFPHLAVVKAGTIVFEVQGLPKDTAYKVLKQASHKLPKNNGEAKVKYKVVERNE
ncbi:8479_t:CDS:2, partial [Ambispora leptoticha]